MTAPASEGGDPVTARGGAAPPRKRVRAQAGLELRLLARNGESVLVTIVIPTAVLAFFTFVPVLPTAGPPVDRLAPTALAIANMGSAMVALGIATAFEREHGVLARLGTTPLGRLELIAAKALAVLGLQAGQVLLLGGTALVLGWRPTPTVTGVLLALLGWLAATTAFAGLGLGLAGRLPAMRALASINALFLALLLLGGLVVPVHVLPGPLAAMALALPASWTGVLLADAAAGEAPLLPLLVLGGWAALAVASASATFRFRDA